MGVVLGAVLLLLVALQIRSQLRQGPGLTTIRAWSPGFILTAVLLLPLNLGLEAWKWRALLLPYLPGITWWRAATSVLAGIAASVVTPNRLGEYPGRMLRLDRFSPYRLVTAAVLGSLSQLVALFLWGAAAAGWYAVQHPAWWTVSGALLSGAGAGLAILFFLRYEQWIPKLARIRPLRRYAVLGRSLGRPDLRRQAGILAWSVLRFAVFTTQFWLLLRGAGVPLPLLGGMLLCVLFFWLMAVVPSIALAEIGIRGGVALFLFSPFTPDRIGILAATLALWLLNLAVPSLLGALVLLRRPLKT